MLLAAAVSGMTLGTRSGGRGRKPSLHVTGRRDLKCEAPSALRLVGSQAPS